MTSSTTSATVPTHAEPAPPDVREDPPHWLDQFTPREIVAELDKYIVGQAAAKKAGDRAPEPMAPPAGRREGSCATRFAQQTSDRKSQGWRRRDRAAAWPNAGSRFNNRSDSLKFTEVGYVGRMSVDWLRPGRTVAWWAARGRWKEEEARRASAVARDDFGI